MAALIWGRQDGDSMFRVGMQSPSVKFVVSTVPSLWALSTSAPTQPCMLGLAPRCSKRQGGSEGSEQHG